MYGEARTHAQWWLVVVPFVDSIVRWMDGMIGTHWGVRFSRADFRRHKSVSSAWPSGVARSPRRSSKRCRS